MIHRATRLLTLLVLPAMIQTARAEVIQVTLGNPEPGFADGDVSSVPDALVPAAAGQPAPFDRSYGNDVIGPDFAASWQFDALAPSTDTIVSAQIEFGIVDHDSGSDVDEGDRQLSEFTAAGVDLTAELDALFEADGEGASGQYDVYTLPLPPSAFAALQASAPSFTLQLQGPVFSPGLVVPGLTLPDAAQPYNGAWLVYSRLTVVTREFDFIKELIAGPDRDGDGVIDRIIEVGQSTPTEVTFRIRFRQPDLVVPAMVLDTVPGNWDLSAEDCVTGNETDLLLVDSNGRGRGPSRIQWHPTDNDSTLTCTIRTRRRGNGRGRGGAVFAPFACGSLEVNAGARAVDSAGNGQSPLFDPDGIPLRSNRLCLGAVEDANGDGVIDWSGNGDEDGDTLSDWLEACELGTDPCNPDTDGDGAADAVDADPLESGIQ